MVFAELLCDFSHTDIETVVEDSFTGESLFLISTPDPWYGDIIIYLQIKTFRPELSKTNHHRIRYQSQQYNIIGDTLYRCNNDSIF